MSSSSAAMTPNAAIDCLDDTLLSEIFGYLTLPELDESTRRVSRAWNKASNERKTYHFQCLHDGSRVRIHGLTSALGKDMNGRVGTIKGTRVESTGRFPVELIHAITGEAQTMGVKPQNLNPFIKDTQEDDTVSNIVKYTSNGKLRMPHGMMLDQVLMLARWECNVIGGFSVASDYTEFMRLPRSHPGLARLNSTMFTWWSRNPALAGIKGSGMSVLDVVVRALISQQNNFLQLGKQTKWDADGPNGELMVRNFVRFMRSWETERITGEFLVTQVYPTGTIMVKWDEEDRSLGGAGERFGKVYLVKGLNSVIGELFSSPLPACVRATILPLYDVLAYDGIIMGKHVVLSQQLRRSLNDHVKEALKSNVVVTCGASASKSLWDIESVPPLPLLPENDCDPIDWGDQATECGSPSDNTMEITPQQKQTGRKIAVEAKKIGVKKDGELLVFRRFGYSEEENPNRLCAVLYNHNGRGDAVHMFPFREGITYNLDEILESLITVIKMRSVGMTSMIMPDEFSVVAPLQAVLDEAFEAEGLDKVQVQWYPPPSEEEAAYATHMG